MKKQTFKTNINCSSCVSKVKPFLDDLKEISHWEVNTEDPEKILTVEGEIAEDKIVTAVKEAGYKIERKKGGWFSFSL